jgi:hypothetical protein
MNRFNPKLEDIHTCLKDAPHPGDDIEPFKSQGPSGGGSPEISVHRSAAAPEFGSNGIYCPAGRTEFGCPSHRIWFVRRFLFLKVEGSRDGVTVSGTKPAVPAVAHVRVLGPKGEREAGQAGLAAGAAGESEFVRLLPLGRDVCLKFDFAARGLIELAVERLEAWAPYERAKLRLAADKEIWARHRSAPILRVSSPKTLSRSGEPRLPQNKGDVEELASCGWSHCSTSL